VLPTGGVTATSAWRHSARFPHDHGPDHPLTPNQHVVETSQKASLSEGCYSLLRIFSDVSASAQRSSKHKDDLGGRGQPYLIALKGSFSKPVTSGPSHPRRVRHLKWGANTGSPPPHAVTADANRLR